MQQIEFIPDHFVDKGFYFLFGKEMAGNIEHQTPPAKSGIVGDRDTRCRPADVLDRPATFDLLGKELVKSLDAIKDTRRLIGPDSDPSRCDGERITFFAESRINGLV